MKKIIGGLLIGMALFSCSDDSDSKALVPTTVTLSSGQTSIAVTRAFDDRRRVTLLSYSIEDDQYTYQFTYNEDGNVAGYHYIAGASDGNVTFTYDSEDRISGVTKDNVTEPVTYAGNSFTYDGNTYSTDGRGNMLTSGVATLAYLNKKGALANVRGWNPLLSVLVDNYFYYYASSKACSQINVEGTVINFAHEFGKGGLPESTLITTNGSAINVVYDYTGF